MLPGEAQPEPSSPSPPAQATPPPTLAAAMPVVGAQPNCSHSSPVAHRPSSRQAFEQMKIRRKHKYIIFKIDTDSEAIVVEKTGGKKATLEEFKVRVPPPLWHSRPRDAFMAACARPTATAADKGTLSRPHEPPTHPPRRDCSRPSLFRSAGTVCTSTSTPRTTAGRPTRYFS